MGLQDLIKDVQIVATVCMQFGDTGKGKIAHYLGAEFDVTARGTGGNNAGHTFVHNGREIITHLIPTAIAFDKDGKINILGNGMVVDPRALVGELNDLEREGISYNHLMVSKDAHVVLPHHITRDLERDKSMKSGGIGTTGRGIGPTYTDKIARQGITIGDLFNRDVLARKLLKQKEIYSSIDIDRTIAEVEISAGKIKPLVRDTVTEMHNFIRQGKKISLEGAQGLLLSVEHGIHPYVTSSDCSVNGTATGVGISAKAIDLTLGIVKFPFMTRVGAGPFPTEFGGKTSEDYCALDTGNKLEDELLRAEVPFEKVNGKIHYDRTHRTIAGMMNSPDEFTQGVGIRLAAGEYGATTGRPRRTGWTDAVALKYAVGINGPLKLVLTKVDSIAGKYNFRIAYSYNNGSGSTFPFSRDAELMRSFRPSYMACNGYPDIRGETNFDKLPEDLRQSMMYLENFVGAPVAVVSTGQDQKETIVR